MSGFPPIADPLQAAYLAASDEEWLASFATLIGSIPGSPFSDQLVDHARSYPFGVVGSSRVLGLPDVSLKGRWPLIAYGANASDDGLARKLGGASIVVSVGQLHGFDVGFSSHIAIYGALPATLLARPHVVSRVALLWLDDAQFATVCATEASYRLGRLDDIVFEPDDGSSIVRSVYAFASRHGALMVDGAAPAQAAVTASGRVDPVWTTAEAISYAAARLGLDSDVDLVRRVVTDPAWTLEARRVLIDGAEPFSHPGWTPYQGTTP